ARGAGRGHPHLLSRRPLAAPRLGLRLRDMSGLPFASRRVRQMDVHAMIETRRRDEGIVFLALFALTIPAANWLIGHAGTVCQPQGPYLIPVAPGLMAPSGVTMAGALVLRDLVKAPARRRGGIACHSRRCRAFGVAGAARARDRFGDRVPALGI